MAKLIWYVWCALPHLYDMICPSVGLSIKISCLITSKDEFVLRGLVQGRSMELISCAQHQYEFRERCFNWMVGRTTFAILNATSSFILLAILWPGYTLINTIMIIIADESCTSHLHHVLIFLVIALLITSSFLIILLLRRRILAMTHGKPAADW